MQAGILEKLQHHLSEPRGRAVVVILVLLASLVLRIILFRMQGYGCDLGLFGAWYNSAAENGLPAFYDKTGFCDYPPFNIYLFWIFGNLSHAIGEGSLPFLIKLPANLFDIATAYLIFRFLRQKFSFKVSLAVMALYAFNPATIYDLAVWGQMDSIYTFFMVASLYSALRSKYELSGGLLALSILTKPQGVILLPVLAYLILRNGGWQRALSSATAFGAIVFLVILPFNWDNPIAFLVDRYAGYDLYKYTSCNAYNTWALFGLWKSDIVSHLGLTYQQWGIIAFFPFLAFVMWQLHRKYEPRSVIFAVFLIMFGFFMLMTRMHERYLFPVLALLALGWYTRFTLWIYIGLTATYLAMLIFVLSYLKRWAYILGRWSIDVLSPENISVDVLAPANIILFALSIWCFYRMQRSKPAEDIIEPPPHGPPVPERNEEQGTVRNGM